MQIIDKDEVRLRKEVLKARILRGEVFIHPTDTIYGIGCNALDEKAVAKVRGIKKRQKEKPFSVIVPSKQWIEDHCILNGDAQEWLDKLPGPYTLILRLKENSKIPGIVNSKKKSIGVRIPDHWISELVSEINVPIITASANHMGEDFMTSMDDLDSALKAKTDFILYDGEKPGKPSTLVNLADEEIDSGKERDIIK